MNYDGFFKYDALVATSYDRDREHEEHWIAEREFVEAFSSSRTLGRVLDVPAGTGRLFDHLRGAAEVVGVDVSADMLAVAAARPTPESGPRPTLVRADALALPFGDRQFDTVLCFRLAHLLPAELVPTLLAELARVCRGCILLQVYAAKKVGKAGEGWMRRLLSPLRVLLPAARTPWSHIHSYAHERTLFEAAAAAAGMSITRCSTLGDYQGSSVVVLEMTHAGKEISVVE